MIEIIVALIAAFSTLIVGVINLISNKKNVKKEDLFKAIDKVELNNCKNYLVQAIAKTENGTELTPVEKERYWENFDTYSSLGGNSYIHSETERLKKEGKL